MLYKHVVVVGASTLFVGLVTRLEAELLNMIGPCEVHICAPDEREYSVWNGAAVLAHLNSFQSEWITKKKYDELGPYIMTSRCI